jgi:hypothetical protein
MLLFTRSTLVGACAVALASGAVLLAQGINLRTGTWEYTMTVEGVLPMEGIPENMRASMEAEFRKPQVFKSCLTAEDLKNFKLGKNDDSDDEECKVLSSKVGPRKGAKGDMVTTLNGRWLAAQCKE